MHRVYQAEEGITSAALAFAGTAVSANMTASRVSIVFFVCKLYKEVVSESSGNITL